MNIKAVLIYYITKWSQSDSVCCKYIATVSRNVFDDMVWYFEAKRERFPSLEYKIKKGIMYEVQCYYKQKKHFPSLKWPQTWHENWFVMLTICTSNNTVLIVHLSGVAISLAQYFMFVLEVWKIFVAINNFVFLHGLKEYRLSNPVFYICTEISYYGYIPNCMLRATIVKYDLNWFIWNYNYIIIKLIFFCP